MRAFENRVLRGKRPVSMSEGGTNGLFKIKSFHSFPNIIKVIKRRRMWAGHVARIRDMRNAYKIVAGNPEGMRPLGRHRWEDNIKMDLVRVLAGFSWLRIGLCAGIL
jgi:hypothetical protein